MCDIPVCSSSIPGDYESHDEQNKPMGYTTGSGWIIRQPQKKNSSQWNSRASAYLRQDDPPGVRVPLGEEIPHLATKETANGGGDREDCRENGSILMAEPDELKPHGHEGQRRPRERAADALSNEDLERWDLNYRLGLDDQLPRLFQCRLFAHRCGMRADVVRGEMGIHGEEPHEKAYDDADDGDEVEGNAPSGDPQECGLCQHQGKEPPKYGAYAAGQLQPAESGTTVVVVSGVGDQRLDCWYDQS